MEHLPSKQQEKGHLSSGTQSPRIQGVLNLDLAEVSSLPGQFPGSPFWPTVPGNPGGPGIP